MTWRIDNIQLVRLAVIGFVHERYALRLDSNTPFAFDIHGIENLFRHFAVCQAPAHLDKTIGQRRFAVIDMGNNREIPDVGRINH